MQDSHRRRTRIHGEFEGALCLGDQEIPIRTDNLSLKGMLCSARDPDQEIPLGQDCEVRFFLAKDAVPVIQGRIVRQDGDMVAVDFSSMDEASYAHLRNMVRFSSDDADAIDFEQAVIPFTE